MLTSKAVDILGEYDMRTARVDNLIRLINVTPVDSADAKALHKQLEKAQVALTQQRERIIAALSATL